MTGPLNLLWDCSCGAKGIPDPQACPGCGAGQPADVLLYPPEEGQQVLLGLWDCVSCDGKGIRGDLYECSECGAHRPDDVKFYLPADAQEITDAAGLAAAKGGADWKCEYCDQLVSGSLSTCPYCAGGDAATGERRAETEEVQLDGEPVATPAAAMSLEGEDAPKAPSGSPLLCCLVLLALAACVAFFSWPKEVGVVVSGHSWERTQKVEDYRTVEEGGWSKPAEAFDVSTSQKVHHTDKVLLRTERRTRAVTRKVQVGEETYQAGTKKVDLGNGRFKQMPVYKKRPKYESRTEQEPYEEKIYKDVPKYQTWYRYKVRKWVEGPPRTTSGEGLEAKWPETSVSDPKTQRMGARSAVYKVHLKSTEQGGQSFSLTCDEDAWRGYAVGSRWTAVVQGGELKRLEPPK
ncbi:MAG: hypothetical protein AB7N76_26930 [Planctomycetota bacterium]